MKQTTRFSSAVRTNISFAGFHVNGWKMAANIGIVKLSLGRRAEEVAIDFGWHVAISVDGAVDELDFQGMESLAVTDCCQRVGMNRLPRNSGSDLALFFRPY